MRTANPKRSQSSREIRIKAVTGLLPTVTLEYGPAVSLFGEVRETQYSTPGRTLDFHATVAPLAGAWIETND